jgi:hypothetical protein
VSRACAVCDWQGTAVETGRVAPDCPWCHAPTRVTADQLLDAPPPLAVGAKNPHAAALGRLGGLKGGRARADRLSARRRREIARRAAEARWRRR